MVWSRKEARPRLSRKKDSGDGTTREKKARKTEAEMDGLCVNRDMRANGTTKYEVNERTGCIEENCVCRSDPTTKRERLEEEEYIGLDLRLASS